MAQQLLVTSRKRNNEGARKNENARQKNKKCVWKAGMDLYRVRAKYKTFLWDFHNRKG